MGFTQPGKETRFLGVNFLTKSHISHLETRFLHNS